MKQVLGNKEDVPGTFSRGGELLICVFMVKKELICVGQSVNTPLVAHV